MESPQFSLHLKSLKILLQPLHCKFFQVNCMCPANFGQEQANSDKVTGKILEKQPKLGHCPASRRERKNPGSNRCHAVCARCRVLIGCGANSDVQFLVKHPWGELESSCLDISCVARCVAAENWLPMTVAAGKQLVWRSSLGLVI